MPVSAQTMDVKDFLYLIGMIYRDDEDELLYVTSSVVVQKGEIVAYRCAYLQNVVGREEPTPIRVADVERMLNAFLKFSQPLVVFAGDVSATRVAALQTETLATPSTSSGATSSSTDQDTNVIQESGAKRSATSSSGSSTAHVPSSGVQPTGTTSHRYPRAAHGKKTHVLNIGQAEDCALHVRVNHNDDVYHINMPKLDVFDHTPFALLNDKSDYAENKAKWDEADLRELKSLVLEHRVWDVVPRSAFKQPMTCKWVRNIKNNDVYKSRVVGRGFNMIPGVDYDETFSPVAKMVTFRIFLTLVAVYSLETAAFDVKTAYLNAKMEKHVEMIPPPGFKDLMYKLLDDPTITRDDRNEIHRQLTALDDNAWCSNALVASTGLLHSELCSNT